MSEAAKLLIAKATKIDQDSYILYKKGLALLDTERTKQQDRCFNLTRAAMEVCEHDEEKRSQAERAESGSHPRYMENYTQVSCAICGKHLRDE